MAANACTRLTLRIFSIILILFFLAATALGIYEMVTVKAFSTVGIGILIFGIIGIVISVFGLLGASYNSKDNGKFAVCLIIFFISMMALCIVFVLLGICCLCIGSTIQWLLTQNKQEILKWFKDLRTIDISNIPKLVDTMITSLTIVGIVCCSIGGLVFFVLIISSIHMGTQLFSKFFIAAGSTVMFASGAVIAGIGGLLFFSQSISKTDQLKALFVILVVAGALLIIWGLLGLVSSCCGNRSRILLFIFVIGVIFLVLIFLAIGIAGIAAQTSVLDTLNKMCEGEGKTTCDRMVAALKENTCSRISDPEEKATCEEKADITAVIDYFKKMIGGWVNIIVGLAFILFIFLACVMISSCLACRQKQQPRDELSASMPDYRQHRDVAY